MWKDEKMIGRPYTTIKDVVFDVIRRTKGTADYEAVTEAVLQHFPDSKWKKSHWGFYRSQITSESGRHRDEFSEEIRANLRRTTSSKEPPEGDTVKRIGDGILANARLVIELAAKEDMRTRFKLRRWVYSRLMQEEIREKRPIKKALWDSGIQACQRCGEESHTIKGVEIHRKDAAEPYSVENCQLLCRKCHQDRM
ncbi:MAG: HNH endonuclease [Phycisphaerae bacterium]|nr:HNH endonuclease [Phycisphaerae bacterium]